jgi:branched-chain amino acid transport system permease protein
MATAKGGLEAAGSDKTPLGLPQILLDAAKAALLAFVLCIPIVALRTEQDMSNRLILEAKWGVVAYIVMAGYAVSLMRHLETGGRLLALFAVLVIGVLFRLYSFGTFGAPAMAFGQAVLFTAAGCAVITAAFLLGRLVPASRGDSGRHVTAMITNPAVTRWIAIGGAVLLLLYPMLALAIVGQAGSIKWIDNFGIQIMIYIMLGWGLNIVVGLAGLLDLGYVAFYAVGAYAYALFATVVIPQYPALGPWAFWICLPVAGIMAAFWGVLLGFPVLRLRGDYLAIVTLAFGEIIRLVLINWVDVTQGYAGISGIPRPSFFGLPFTDTPNGFAAFFGLEHKPLYRTIFLFYVILALALLTNWVTMRLRKLPVGRAWEALREDEIACRSLGINTTNTKLTAFAIGAMFGGFAGSFFAARQGFISPESFTFVESAVIIAIVVLGGMGSQIGVAIAAIAMIGGTEILRELDWLKALFGKDFDPTQYRMLIFGLAMVVLMIWRPRGLISTREPTIALKEARAISGSLVKEGHG